MNNSSIISSVFDNRAEAERAVTQLRAAGVAESAISIVAQRDGKDHEQRGVSLASKPGLGSKKTVIADRLGNGSPRFRAGSSVPGEVPSSVGPTAGFD